MNNILVIDDEEAFLTSVKRALVISGFKGITLVNNPERIALLLNRDPMFDIALIDMNMPAMNGIEVLSLIKQRSPSTECIMITARNEARIAVECLKRGAYDYLVKPIRPDDLIRVINHAIERKRLIDIVELNKTPLNTRPTNSLAFSKIVTKSSEIYSLLREAELHAISEMPILISGETGTGKELLARAIHEASSRAKGPFLAINMGALTENLFESAFFGHTKGAFTGAQREHIGFLETSNGGTLFLDEIGTLPNELQSKLLRVLQEKEFIKIGTNKPRSADVRFIAATNADLHQLMGAGLFRKDIYYRLRGAQLNLPPLRERKKDIPDLIAHFLEEFCSKRNPPEITTEAMDRLIAYNYPGNIRELKAIIQSAINLSNGGLITLNSLPSDIGKLNIRGDQGDRRRSPISFNSLADMEKEHIRSVIKETDGNLTHSAKILGVCLNTLRKKLQSYGIDRK
jgi:DNA-binding NtrC family response regulator